MFLKKISVMLLAAITAVICSSCNKSNSGAITLNNQTSYSVEYAFYSHDNPLGTSANGTVEANSKNDVSLDGCYTLGVKPADNSSAANIDVCAGRTVIFTVSNGNFNVHVD